MLLLLLLLLVVGMGGGVVVLREVTRVFEVAAFYDHWELLPEMFV